MNQTQLDQDEILHNEKNLLQGLIEAGNFRDDTSLRRKIKIRRNGKLLFSFTVRPLDEEEEGICRSKATKKYPNPAGGKLPTIEGPTDWVKFRSWKIYMATIEEDRTRIWDNQEFRRTFDVLNGVDMIDKVLRTGDKDAICTIIEDISGFSETDGDDATTEDAVIAPQSLEEYAKN